MDCHHPDIGRGIGPDYTEADLTNAVFTSLLAYVKMPFMFFKINRSGGYSPVLCATNIQSSETLVNTHFLCSCRVSWDFYR